MASCLQQIDERTDRVARGRVAEGGRSAPFALPKMEAVAAVAAAAQIKAEECRPAALEKRSKGKQRKKNQTKGKTAADRPETLWPAAAAC